MTAAAVRQTFLETRLLAGRSLRHIPRVPEKLADVTIQPIIFVTLFAYVFGSAISVPGNGSYREYLIGGMFAQAVLGTAVVTAIGLVVGWAPHGSVAETAAAYALLVLWSFAGVWIGILSACSCATARPPRRSGSRSSSR